MALEGLYKLKLQDSVQLETTLAMYEQEIIRINEQPNCSKLKIAVRRHVDQQMRTRNFRARNEIFERGAATKTPKKGRGAVVERKVGECFQWQAIGQCSRGYSCSSSHAQASERDAARDKKNRRPLPHLKRRHRLTKSYPQKVQATEARPLVDQEAEIRAEISSKESARTRHVIIGTLPCVLITSMKQDAHMEQSADFDMLRGRRSPAKSRRKVVGQGSVALLKDSTQLGCVFRDSHPRKTILWKVGTIGIKTHRQNFQGHLAPVKKFGKERVHRQASFKSVNLMSAIRAPPGSRRGHKMIPCMKK